MKCPVCKDVNLAIADRQGVEIDYCPECCGVWLDRGELNKIIEKSIAEDITPPQTQYGQHNYRDDRYIDNYKYSNKRKRKGLLGELFDFD
ncbi:MAG: hypothetical protein C4543_04705 [Ignavibacteriales bacterium]|jgi:Zn-finger nucleic acid-binding protein|nr:MAG: hypothetical protein C4543_04705 [Ignavibacteriales bacterium]